jgi:hypothetical protein
VTRIANAGPGIAIALLAWPLAEDLSGYAAFACLAPLAAGAILAVRGYRMSMSVGGSCITLRGLLGGGFLGQHPRVVPRAGTFRLRSRSSGVASG